MFARFVPCLAALALVACDRVGAPAEVAPAPTPLDAPSRDAEPLSGFAPGNDAARAATGALRLRLATRMPDAEEAARGAAPQDVLTLTGETGLIVEAALTGAATPATQIGGQTLRALLGVPVEVSQTLVYRVSAETKPESGQGLCGEDEAAYLVVWESDDPGATALKLIGVAGAAPGQPTARACPMLDYSRS